MTKQQLEAQIAVQNRLIENHNSTISLLSSNNRQLARQLEDIRKTYKNLVSLIEEVSTAEELSVD